MLEQAILGTVQGIAEWLPVSSEGLLVLIKSNFFNDGRAFHKTIQMALFFHFGTFLAALIYFHKDVCALLKCIVQSKSQDDETKKLMKFLFISTLISGTFGLCLIALVSKFMHNMPSTEKVVNLIIGTLLLFTAFLELKAKKGGYKEIKDLTTTDGIVLGIVQGFAALPGLSRSGLTVSALLLRKFEKVDALKLSFLMSLPIVLGGNIILNSHVFDLSQLTLIGLACSFVFGLATIHILLKVAQAINFGYFVLFFGILTILSTLI